MEKIKILFLAADPNRPKTLQLDEEIRSITQKIRASEYRDSLDLVSKWAVRPDDLLQYLNEHKPHIVHFSGHGNSGGEILLVDNNGISKPIGQQTLTTLFTTLKGNIRVVILNACDSQVQAQAITEVIDCAIGMNAAISDPAAITFAAAFYRAIGFGCSVKKAFEQGKISLMLEGIPEINIPVLFARKGVDSDQIVLISASTDTQGNDKALEIVVESPFTPMPAFTVVKFRIENKSQKKLTGCYVRLNVIEVHRGENRITLQPYPDSLYPNKILWAGSSVNGNVDLRPSAPEYLSVLELGQEHFRFLFQGDKPLPDGTHEPEHLTDSQTIWLSHANYIIELTLFCDDVNNEPVRIENKFVLNFTIARSQEPSCQMTIEKMVSDENVLENIADCHSDAAMLQQLWDHNNLERTKNPFQNDKIIVPLSLPTLLDNKFKFLYFVYVKSRADKHVRVELDEIRNELGLPEQRTISTGQYLNKNGLINFKSLAEGIKITHKGITRVESDLLGNNKLPEYVSQNEVKKIEERTRLRFNLLQYLCGETEGDTSKFILHEDLAKKSGIEHDLIIFQFLPYMDSEGWISWKTNDLDF